MDKQGIENMSRAALVIGLSLGIGVEQALAAEANEQSHKDVILGSKTDGAPQNPNVFKFVVDPNKPVTQTDSTGVIQKHESPNAFKLTDVIVSSAKDETNTSDGAKPSGKANTKPRSNARKRAPN